MRQGRVSRAGGRTGQVALIVAGLSVPAWPALAADAPCTPNGVDVVCVNTGVYTQGVAATSLDLNNKGTFSGGVAVKIGKVDNQGTFSGGLAASTSLDLTTAGTWNGGFSAGSAKAGNYGTFKGPVTADKLELTNTKDFTGDLSVGDAKIANSGTFTGVAKGVTFDVLNQGAWSGALTGTTTKITNQSTWQGDVSSLNLQFKNIGAFTGNLNGLNSTIANSGTFVGSISAFSLDLDNTGKMTGDVTGKSTKLTNSGEINGDLSAQSLTLTNSGTINGNTSAMGAEIVNSGTIKGDVNAVYLTLDNRGAIQGTVAADSAATLDNSGSIRAGASGVAVQFTASPNTLIWREGSRIVGDINLGGGGDTVRVEGKGNYALTFDTLAGATIDTGGRPHVVAGSKLIIVDPAATTARDQAMIDFGFQAGGIVDSRMREIDVGDRAPTVMAYAPSGAQATRREPVANVWARALGGGQKTKASSVEPGSTSRWMGGAAGFDGAIGGSLRVGAFAGAANVSTALQNSDDTSRGINYFGGFYSRVDVGPMFFDVALTGGYVADKVRRQVIDNTAAGGVLTVESTPKGYYAVPQFAWGLRIDYGSGLIVTPILRGRYLIAGMGSYAETYGSAPLEFASRKVQVGEVRAEVGASKSFMGGATRFYGHLAGVGQHRFDDGRVSATAGGAPLAFGAAGRTTNYGVAGGLGFEAVMIPRGRILRASLFGEVEGSYMVEGPTSVTARAGVRGDF